MSNGHRVVARLTLAVAAALILPAAARAACLALPGDPGSGEAYQYMSAVVASMGHAKKGLDTLKKQGKADHGSERLYRMKVAGESYACAQRLIERFRESSDRRIRETADVLTIGFENLGHSNRQAAEMMVAVMKASAPVSEGTLSDAGAMLRQQDDGAWRDLMLALALTPQAMPLYNPDGSNAKRLRLKKSERQELQGELERTFGKSIRTGVLNGQEHLTTAAAGIHTFRGTPGSGHWTTADELRRVVSHARPRGAARKKWRGLPRAGASQRGPGDEEVQDWHREGESAVVLSQLDERR